MVDDRGQLYTIEGVAAAILMVFTAYLMLSSTTLYTPGETHVTEMQMEQLGNDALAMMDTSSSIDQPSPLENYIYGDTLSDKQKFASDFTQYLNTTKSGYNGNFKFIANVSYRNATNSIASYKFYQVGDYTGREHTVKVTRWVFVPNDPLYHAPENTNLPGRNQTVLLEVLLWRD